MSDTGGPAHPCICGRMVKHGTIHMCDAMEPGPISIDDDPSFKFVPPPSMTLLDYFAGQSLAGAVQAAIAHSLEGHGEWDIKEMSKDMYRIAEAMIAEKRRREES